MKHAPATNGMGKMVLKKSRNILQRRDFGTIARSSGEIMGMIWASKLFKVRKDGFLNDESKLEFKKNGKSSSVKNKVCWHHIRKFA